MIQELMNMLFQGLMDEMGTLETEGVSLTGNIRKLTRFLPGGR